jgi:arginyl-tRNA synthetase
LKFFLLRVNPKKKILFNPEESIDFHGFTAPFVQYTYARIQSVLRKLADENLLQQVIPPFALLPQEKEVITELEQFPTVIKEAAAEQDPSKIAVYAYNLAKIFNQFYTDLSIANAENKEKKILRAHLAQLTGIVIRRAMQLLGIDVPERM